MEFWNGESLDFLASRLGRLLKIDDHTMSVSRARFARICVEIDISKPLHKALWVGNKENRVLAVILYERLPVFCYSCGTIGHGASNCLSKPVTSHAGVAIPGSSDPRDHSMGEQPMQEDVARPVLAPPSECPESSNSSQLGSSPPEEEDSFGPWMVVQRRRGRARGRGPANFTNRRGSNSDLDTWPQLPPDVRHVEDPLPLSLSRSGRGGRGGRGSDFAAHLSRHLNGRIPSSNVAPDEPLDAMVNIHTVLPSGASKGFELCPKLKFPSLSAVSSPALDPSPLVFSSIDCRDPHPQNPPLLLEPAPPSVEIPPPSLPPSPPLLISSKLYPSPNLRSSSDGSSFDPDPPPSSSDPSHALLVGQVQEALVPQPRSQGSSGLSAAGVSLDESMMDPDDEEMSLGQFQNEAKLEALARRSCSSGPPRSKKGKKAPILS